MRRIEELYRAMGRAWSKDLPVEQDLRRWRFKLLKYFVLWLAGLAGVVSLVTWKYYSGIVISKEPLLKGPPEFILLALVVAFTAYLRQVHVSAIEQRDKIRKGEVWNYPLHRPYHEYAKEGEGSRQCRPESRDREPVPDLAVYSRCLPDRS
jgi:hypothetical protein